MICCLVDPAIKLNQVSQILLVPWTYSESLVLQEVNQRYKITSSTMLTQTGSVLSKLKSLDLRDLI